MNLIADNKSTPSPWNILDKLKPYTHEEEDSYNKKVQNSWILNTNSHGTWPTPINPLPLPFFDQDVKSIHAEMDKMLEKCVELTIKKVKAHLYKKYGSGKLTENEMDEIKRTFETSHILNGSRYFILIPMWKSCHNIILDDLFFDYKIHSW